MCNIRKLCIEKLKLKVFKMSNPLSKILPSEEYPKRLAAFDFDQTIIELNSDVVVRALVDRKQISQEVENIVSTQGWTEYMQEIFRILHKSSIKPARIKKAVIELNEVPGMVKCIKTLKQLNFDIIIISDSNSVFINEWITAHNLHDTIKEIFTNPAHFDENGLLIIKPYHHQTECKISAANMCKGRIMLDFIDKMKKKDITYQNTLYIGDGSNDICPALKLSINDYAFVKKDFSMDRNLLRVASDNNVQFLAKSIKWKTGFELMNEILKAIDAKI